MRVSASDLDALRYFRHDDEASLDELLARLRRQAEPTDAMLAGTALHKALELSQAGDVSVLQSDGYRFDFDTDAQIELPAIRELKATREYLIDGEPITLVGVVDAMHGRTVWDHKLTGRFDPERFLGSMQWRAYLEIFEADRFVWNVFEGREAEPRRWVIFHVHTLECTRYPGMADALTDELRMFLDFARQWLPERIESTTTRAA